MREVTHRSAPEATRVLQVLQPEQQTLRTDFHFDGKHNYSFSVFSTSCLQQHSCISPPDVVLS
jgi:hypothetical protein